MATDPTEYAGFWRRFAAFWLDIVVLLPVTAFVFWGAELYRLFNVYYLVPGTLVGLFYHVYLVRRFGGTPGKLIMRLRIRKISGEAVGYREALLRNAPEFLLGLLISVALLAPLLQMTDAQYHALSFTERSKRLLDLAPVWFRPVQVLQNIWIWSEFIVMLTNRKRRALHDFVAAPLLFAKRRTEATRLTATKPDFHAPSVCSGVAYAPWYA